MTGSSPDVTIFLFDTTTAALWAEDVAVAREIPAEVLPAPDDAEAKCNLALQTLANQAEGLRRALEEEGVPFHVYPGALAPRGPTN